MPGRRGKRAGVGAILQNTCNVWSRAPAYGVTASTPAAARPSWRRRGGAVGRLLRRYRALPGDDVAALGQQRRRVLEDHRQRGERAGGHEVVRRRGPRRHSSARAWTTVDVGRARRPRPRARGSGSAGSRSRRAQTCASGSAAASARPGQPAPEPRSAIRRAPRTGASASADSESATWRSTAASKSRTRRRSGRIGGLQPQDPRPAAPRRAAARPRRVSRETRLTAARRRGAGRARCPRSTSRRRRGP